ncbi:MAG: ECF-type riboflavin transporter substrate-binding protein [Eubacteriaceae bacterium]|nr:ECF-type riboflavin transporter substrate-binding protein [Eubacteriaceae bacterium]
MKNLSTRTVVAIGVGSAIFFLLARFLSIPVFANTYLTLQYAVLGFFAALYGPIAGLLIGLIGHVLTDLSYGGIWWSWVIASTAVGFISGYLLKGVRIDEGSFGSKGAASFIGGSLAAHGAAWLLIAPGLDILIYKEPSSKVFIQGAWAFFGDFVTTAVVGTLLLAAYASTRTRSKSL